MKQIQALFIESGHGFPDVGAVNIRRLATERGITKDIGKRVLEILKSKVELEGVLIQPVAIDTNASVTKKMKYVNEVIKKNKFNPNKCLGITIHVNGNYDRSGVMFYYQNNKFKLVGSLIGNSIMAAMEKYFAVCFEGARPDTASRFKRLYIRDANCPYVLIETGYIGSDIDLDRLRNQPDRVAESIAHGIMNYLRK